MRWIRPLAGMFLACAALLGVGWGAAKIYLLRNFDPTSTTGPRGYRSIVEIAAAIKLGALPLANLKPTLPSNVVENLAIEYGRIGDRRLELDLYAPRSISSPAPCLLFVHGGAWKGGKREDYRVYTTHFASLGYVTASASYRLSKEAPFPAAVEDVKCAVRWLRANASRLTIDPERIVILGGSAGGHLALMTGFSPGKFEGSGGHENVSSAVRAVVDIYGPADLTTEFAQKAAVVRKFMGDRDYASAPDLWLAASPIHYLTSNAPPVLILHGTLDDIVPIGQSDDLAARLRRLGVPVEYEKLEGWPHTMDASEPVNRYFKQRMEAFLRKYVGHPGQSRSNLSP